MSALLDIRSLSAQLKSTDQPVLRDVSLTLQPREVHGLVGESGAGKTTIAKAILGILPQAIAVTGGEVLFEGQDLLKLGRHGMRALLGREIALIPQDPLTALNPSRRIASQIMDGLIAKRGLSRREARDRALSLLQEVYINDPERVMRAFPHQLSGGMRQRVLIASAFGLEPRLIIADEPTTALDVTVQKQILRLIRIMQDVHNTAIVFVTHDLGVVAQICDRVSVLYAGKVVEQSEVTVLFRDPQHAYTRALIAANPRYDDPNASLVPVSDTVVRDLHADLDGTASRGSAVSETVS
ncbi:MAG: ABC transporter ATP-binding protein [Pseudomonadota bacterium]